MPAQKRPLPPPSDDWPPASGDASLLLTPPPPVASSPPPEHLPATQLKKAEEVGAGDDVRMEKAEEEEEEEQKAPLLSNPLWMEEVALPPEQQRPQKQEYGSEGEGGGSQSDFDEEEAEREDYIVVKLADLRREVQCPICLGIIRKTRTVMECLHRFCRECIDKSMRLGNNECPACRTHCASRRSLRDDPKYDTLIAALYPDIDKYEEEELALCDEEKYRNKRIQAAIAETFRRQSAALGRKRTAKATAAAFLRKSLGNFRSNSREITIPASDDDDEEVANGIDGSKESSSADEPSPERRQKRCRRWLTPRSSPARAAGIADVGSEETDNLEVNRENTRMSPLRAGNREMLAWGKNGTRSQTRHGNTSGSNGRMAKGGRMAKLVDYLRHLDENEDEFDIHLTLVSLDKESIPNLQQPYLCCRPTLSIRHLCEFIALQTRVQAEEVQLYARKPQDGTLATKSMMEMPHSDPLVGLQILTEQEELLATLFASFTTDQGELVLVYSLKLQS